MKLTQLDPRWTAKGVHPAGEKKGEPRHGMGLSFQCPCATCATSPQGAIRLGVQFKNPLDGGPAFAGGKHWLRKGDTFEQLSLEGEIDASNIGHWRGTVTAGELSMPLVPVVLVDVPADGGGG